MSSKTNGWKSREGEAPIILSSLCCCYERTFGKKVDEISIAHDLSECERKMVVLKYQQEYTDDIMIALEIAIR